MTLTLRDARLEDLDFIVRGNSEMARETEGLELDPGLIGPGVRAVLHDASLGRYFIAEADGTPAGQLLLTYEWSDWRNGVFWWIQSVFVEPAWRRKGVFSALFGHVHELAAGNPSVCGLRLYVDRANDRAHHAYARLGLHLTHYDLMETVFRGPASHRGA